MKAGRQQNAFTSLSLQPSPVQSARLSAFTSRNGELIVQLGVSGRHVFNAEGMSKDEGFRFLEKHLTEDQTSNRDDTVMLLETLGYLPLTIKQASANMAENKSRRQSISAIAGRATKAQNPIAATWLISFRQIEDHDTLAADYLKFMCFLSEKAIPRSLLPHDPWSLKAEDVIGTLKSYAFITEREQSNIYDIHRLVRLAMLNWLDKQCELEKWTVNRTEKADLLFKIGCGFEILGQYNEAETTHRQALEIREKILGRNNPDTLTSVRNLGLALERQRLYERAEALYRRALDGRLKVLGPDHPDILASISNWGDVLVFQGEYEKVEAMFRRALKGREKVLGSHHPDTLSSARKLDHVF
ncbi:hypothetical protein VTN49DRAFT_5676 [Thermomyces lanuginosus]|uniref:uncharacterized protein n=1 Tax=Thermomyces lanuginosus TaxID=5541 RepID=UPI003742F0D0